MDGIHQYSELAIEKFHMDSPAFNRPKSPAQIAFVLDETIVADDLIRQIADELMHTEKYFLRIAIIGADKKSQRKLEKVLFGGGFVLEFFDGIEPAKEWLVSEDK